MAAEYQRRRLSGAVTTFAVPVTILPAKRKGASAIFTGNGLRLRELPRGTSGTYYQGHGGGA